MIAGLAVHRQKETRMSPIPAYSSDEPSRAEVDAKVGNTVIEFGSNGCGICQATQGVIAEALAEHTRAMSLQHIKIEDGPGRPLGRSFGVKLWPTLVMMSDGREVARVVRPRSLYDVSEALARLKAAADQAANATRA